MATDEKSKDEQIDGARVAALILNKMKGPAKERIVEKIQKADPQAALMIETKMTRFEEVRNLTVPHLQALLREVDEQDLVITMQSAAPEIKEKLLSNLSKNKQEFVKEEMRTLLPADSEEMEEAKWRITQKLEKLKSSGVIDGPKKRSVIG